MIKDIKVALLGLGTIGKGFYRVMEEQKESILNQTGANVQIVKILEKDFDKDWPDYVDKSLFTNDWESIIKDDEIQIIVELIGGTTIAKKFVKEALEKGKHVVTANKDMVAAHGSELFEIADKNKLDFAFEAAVGGGIPIIRPLKQCLAGNNIHEILGIINGTTNYILTKMTQEKQTFIEALKTAQDLGYAEADPTADISGLDAARKMAILASLAFHTKVNLDQVYLEGITNITSSDIEYADEFDYIIKLIGLTKKRDTGIEVRVHPMLIPKRHPLASVDDSFNAIFIKGNPIGETMFFGHGAGQLPTASAVVGDVIDVVRNIVFVCNGRVSCTCYLDEKIVPNEKVVSKYFIRLFVENKPGVLAEIAGSFGNHNVSIASVIQKKALEKQAELVIITDSVMEKGIFGAMEEIKKSPILKEVSSMIRVYEDGRK